MTLPRRIAEGLIIWVLGFCLIGFILFSMFFSGKKDTDLLDQITTGDFKLKDTWTEHNGWT